MKLHPGGMSSHHALQVSVQVQHKVRISLEEVLLHFDSGYAASSRAALRCESIRWANDSLHSFKQQREVLPEIFCCLFNVAGENVKFID